ncbi:MULTISPECIES: hypothetical protein [Frankia]|uniref:Uncharacterized protein n=1 Tax=Frankia alni (strain DSM 45986 / CECT 9034 / ACN14a) TaxID=326424 RepID=Q0RPW9_FRAAA|nr:MULTISPECIES: hypothetical protein [Frankia]CAJ60410.1 hypothetical protein FRAAL1758 [Frankia alni ACN14a]
MTASGGQTGDGPPSLVERLGLVLSARIAGELPDADRDMVEVVVGRVLELLARSAAVNRSHPLADATLYLMAHALEDQDLHRSLAGIRLQLPGLTVDTAAFHREAELLRWLGRRGGPSQD